MSDPPLPLTIVQSTAEHRTLPAYSSKYSLSGAATTMSYAGPDETMSAVERVTICVTKSPASPEAILSIVLTATDGSTISNSSCAVTLPRRKSILPEIDTVVEFLFSGTSTTTAVKFIVTKSSIVILLSPSFTTLPKSNPAVSMMPSPSESNSWPASPAWNGTYVRLCPTDCKVTDRSSSFPYAGLSDSDVAQTWNFVVPSTSSPDTWKEISSPMETSSTDTLKAPEEVSALEVLVIVRKTDGE